MAKPVINDKGYMTENPADRTGGVRGPLGRGADASAGVHAGPLGLANKVGFKVMKTIEDDSVEQTIESNLFVATKTA